MPHLVVRPLRAPLKKRAAVLATIAVLGLWLALRGVVPYLAGLLALGCGVWALVTLRALGEDRERIVLDDAGIRDASWPIGMLAWREVTGASVQRIGRYDVVALALRDPAATFSRLTGARRLLAEKAHAAGLPALYLSPAGTDATAVQLAVFVNEQVRRYGSRA